MVIPHMMISSVFVFLGVTLAGIEVVCK
jgi:hypothetical protein